MKVSLGGARTTLAVAVALLAAAVLAGCTSGADQVQEEPVEVPDGHGLVTIWMARPANAAELDVQVLTAVPRFVVFTPADEDTIKRTNSTGYVDVTKGWTDREEGWSDGEYPRSAQQDWLYTHDIWYKGTIPAGNYSSVRIELIDQHIVMRNAQPQLFIGNLYESTGYPRLTFNPDPNVGVFQVKDGEELALSFQTTLEVQSHGRVLIH